MAQIEDYKNYHDLAEYTEPEIINVEGEGKQNTKRFEYFVELKTGYVPVMKTEEEAEVHFVIDARNRATADRAVKAMLKDAGNVESWGCIGIEHDLSD